MRWFACLPSAPKARIALIRVSKHSFHWPCGLMDEALVFGTKDCRFESCQGHFGVLALFRWRRLTHKSYVPRYAEAAGCETTTTSHSVRHSQYAMEPRLAGTNRKSTHTHVKIRPPRIEPGTT